MQEVQSTIELDTKRGTSQDPQSGETIVNEQSKEPKKEGTLLKNARIRLEISDTCAYTTT